MNGHDGSDERPDGMARWREWLEHQYVAGYYTGGRLLPFLRGRRPNRYGWVLVVTGALTAAAAAFSALTAGWPPKAGALISLLLGGGLAALQLAAGVRLLGRR